MTHWLLLGGAVTLDGLGQRAFWRIVLVSPVTMALIYLMIPSRFPSRQAQGMLLALYGVLWAVFLIAHLTVLPRGPSGLVGQLVKGLLEYAAFPLYYSKYRDWRTVFLMLTGGVICLQANSIGNLLMGGLGCVAAIGRRPAALSVGRGQDGSDLFLRCPCFQKIAHRPPNVIGRGKRTATHGSQSSWRSWVAFCFPLLKGSRLDSLGNPAHTSPDA